MKRILTTLALTLLSALFASSASASFGFKELDVGFENKDGSPAMEAGSHPYAMKTTIFFNTAPDKAIEESGVGYPGFESPDGDLRGLTGLQALGLVARPGAVETCSTADFFTSNTPCPKTSQIGISNTIDEIPPAPDPEPLYNLAPPPGVLLRIGFKATGAVPVILDVGLTETAPYRGVVRLADALNTVQIYGSEVTLWGVPGDAGHNSERAGVGAVSNENPQPFLTLPRACAGPLSTTFSIESWQGETAEKTVLTHDDSVPSNPLGVAGCEGLSFSPSVSAVPTSKAASSPSGLDVEISLLNEGITSADGRSASDIEKTVFTLPEGFSANPALAEGLVVCTEEQLTSERVNTAPGEGCPSGSKIGTVEAESPLVDQTIKGSIFIAKPYENPFGSLLAFYFVLRNEDLGIVATQAAKVEPNPQTGRLTTIAEGMPQLPISHIRLHFREGARSPLATPSACGAYDGHDAAHEPVRAKLYPSSGAPPVTSTASFQLFSGPDGGPCPSGGLSPFHPQLTAGTLNNAAGAFSPFNVKITRSDSEQEITHFSIKLPPGVAGKLAGIPFCSDAQIQHAIERTGPHGGREELDDPSCPAAAQVGRTIAGAGVGPALTYAPGKVYLAGPYHGAPISFVAITAGVVGPFDIGTVVVRLAVRVNPETGEVFLDSTGSDPIPHIIKGIPVHLRDIRAYTDRSGFTFNPTSCARKSTAATVLGSGLDFASEADDNPFVSTSPFQAADCAALPFRPALSLRVQGGTKRGDFPRLKAFVRMNGFGEAGIARSQVTLPRSEFIANAHFNTICTRVQFKEAGGNGEACPAGSIYGWARAKSPILADPLEGPIFLRSSEHQLPDVVASLRGQEIDVHLVGHVDSVKGQLRNTFETVPDAPVEWASFSFKGGKKGLFENSTDLCAGTNRADIRFTGQNGKHYNYRPAVKARCRGDRGHRRRSRHQLAGR
jgi:hypothetical protein